ncbi:hypothetical protein OTU49_014803, partial [Cherax quadricarinatus]
TPSVMAGYLTFMAVAVVLVALSYTTTPAESNSVGRANSEVNQDKISLTSEPVDDEENDPANSTKAAFVSDDSENNSESDNGSPSVVSGPRFKRTARHGVRRRTGRVTVQIARSKHRI